MIIYSRIVKLHLNESVGRINKLGLHARASSKLTQLGCSFSSDIFLIKDKDKVNAKSIMEVLVLAASINTIISLETNGADEKEAMKSIESLFNNYFGDDN